MEKKCELFHGMTAWFSDSTPTATRSIWVRAGGSVEDAETAEFLFSDDVKSPDTHILYPGAQIIVFHSDYVRTAFKLRNLPAVTDYALDPWPLIDFWKSQSMASEVPSSCDITDSETDDVASPSITETRMSANEATIGAQLEEELISKSVDVHRRAVAVRKMPRDVSGQLHRKPLGVSSVTNCSACSAAQTAGAHCGAAASTAEQHLLPQTEEGMLNIENIDTSSMSLEDFDPKNSSRYRIAWKTSDLRCTCH